jgi:uncharacterized iron-regulated membrane protein
MTHDSEHLVIGIPLFAVAIAMLAATVSWFYVIGGAIMRLIAKPAAGSQALAASRPATVSRQADCGACWCSKTSRALVT